MTPYLISGCKDRQQCLATKYIFSLFLHQLMERPVDKGFRMENFILRKN